jgi:hypothetical protein
VTTTTAPTTSALLLAAVYAVTGHLHGRVSAASAAEAATLYAHATGTSPTAVIDRITEADALTRRSPAYTGSRHDARVTHLHLLEPGDGDVLACTGGGTLTAVRRAGRIRLTRATGGRELSPRQATRRGALHPVGDRPDPIAVANAAQEEL